ncbi:MAG: cysteine hydrolase [Clostridia bacterium]|nr:cysteine hydrolase [Clostridia bacterium]
MHVLIVVDMQKDFIDGALGTPEAVAIVPKVAEKIRDFDGLVLATRDTHTSNYLETQEGHHLPVVHCVLGTPGWGIHPEIAELLDETPIDKPTFGSVELMENLRSLHAENPIGSITLVGLCTDICVISNAIMAKAALPEVPVLVDAACCAGVTPESHKNALQAMRMCQIQIENGED